MISCMICNTYIRKVEEKQTNKEGMRYKISCSDCETIIILFIPNKLYTKLPNTIDYLDSILNTQTKEIK